MTVDGTQLPGGFTGTGNVIGVTTDGTLIYHTDTSGLQVHSYMPDGTLVNSFSVITQTTFPEGITYNPNTDHLYVVNGSGENIVSEYQTDGTHVMNYPVLGSSQDGVAYDPVRDSYWLYDSGTDTVREYDTSFNVITSFLGTINAGYSGGEGVAVIGDRLYVMASGSSTVVVFNIGEPIEAPWLHEVPLSGTVPAQASDQIDVIFDATVVGLGTYNATIIIENDGVDGNIQIPVTMTVSLFDIYMPVVLKD
jgi:DNA-binding beta-propeller fold protein YncE